MTSRTSSQNCYYAIDCKRKWFSGAVLKLFLKTTTLKNLFLIRIGLFDPALTKALTPFVNIFFQKTNKKS
jgi:hypothetical protein